MSVPIVEQIARKILARLEQVTIDNGYTWDAACTRPTRLDMDAAPKDKQILLLQEQRFLVEDGSTDGASEAVEWRQQFAIVVFAMASDTDDDPIDTLVNVRQADIEKALHTPTDDETVVDWARIDGLALNSNLGEPEWIEGADFSGSIIRFIAHYRVKENDPYTQA